MLDKLLLCLQKMGVDDELSTPILHSDGEEETTRRSFTDDELNVGTGCGTACCNPASKCHRFIALILMCLVGFGNYLFFHFYHKNSLQSRVSLIISSFLASYFCYDNPGALQNYFMKDMDMSTTQFVWLYSIYSWPNVVLCFIGGFLMDR